MALAPRQLEWSFPRFGISYCKTRGYFRRFVIIGTTNGYSVSDQDTGEIARVTTFAAAKAWAGIKVGERVVRH